ncbi:uncharacterized protein LOC123474019 [Daphnia magna]|uniref:uncharacterized protein LOC123474019 n=1 Tax=Daphnia magna TaxID=35525 RepID=UPI001E1BA0C4|nr:uncharacterized protein LOC123474019 [Daphnia magna]
MLSPRMVRFSTVARVLLPVLVVSTFVIGCSLVANLMSPTSQQMLTARPCCEQQLQPMASDAIRNLILEKEILQSKLNEFLNEGRKSFLLKSAKFLRRENLKLLAKLKVYEQERRRKAEQSTIASSETLVGETNLSQIKKVTVNRDFFDYISNCLRDSPYAGVENYTRYAVARLGLAPLTNVEPLLPEFGPVINDVLSFRYPISVAASCPSAALSGKSTVFIAVISATMNFHQRTTIRRTWKSHVQAVHRNGPLAIAGFAFILGLSEDDGTQRRIEEESQLYGDVIQIGMSDFYRNLPLKIAGLLNWLRSHCAGEIDFLLKVDDDVYVNVSNLAHFVRSYRHSNMSVFGSGTPIKGHAYREGKWQISYAEWPWIEYPPYILGAISLISGSSILPLLAACQTTPMLPFEDVYFFGLCVEKAGIKTLHLSDRTGPFRRSVHHTPTVCDVNAMVAWRMNDAGVTKLRELMESSHQVAEDVYTNKTQCIVVNGTRRSFDHTEPVVQ